MLSQTSGLRLLEVGLGHLYTAADRFSFQFTETENPSGSPLVRYSSSLAQAKCESCLLKGQEIQVFLSPKYI